MMWKTAAVLMAIGVFLLARPVWAQQQQPERSPRQAFMKADTSNDGKVTFDEIKAVAPNMTKERFDKVDLDRDGFLTKDDFKNKAARHPGEGRGAQFMKKFEQADADQDGKIAYADAQRAFPKMTQERFALLDADKDGSLTVDEVKASMGRFMDRLKQADADKDGKITFSEAQTAFPRMDQEKFNRLDRNGDGAITAQEMKGPGGPTK